MGDGTPGDFDENYDDAEWEPSQWIPPEDRLWRHPSEVSAQGGSGWPSRSSSLPARTARHRRYPVPALAVLLAAGAVLAETAHLFNGPPSTGSGHVLASKVHTETQSAVTVAVSTLGQATAPSAHLPGSLARNLAEVEVLTPTGVLAGAATETAVNGIYLTSARLTIGNDAVLLLPTDRHGSAAAMAARLLGQDPLTGIAVISTTGPARPAASHDRIESSAVSSIPSACVHQPAAVVQPAIDGQLIAEKAVIDALETNVSMPDGSAALGNARLTVEGPPPALGSPVVCDGHLAGIVTYADPTTVLAAPLDEAEEAAQQIVQQGRVVHGWIGVEASTVSIASLGPGLGIVDAASGLSGPSAAVVQAVADPSPAAAAGLQPGDVIVSVDEAPIASALDLEAAIALTDPGTSAVLGIDRDGYLMPVAVTVGASPVGAGAGTGP